MKLLLCPKGFIGVMVLGKQVYIESASDETHGYALVLDAVADELLKRDGYTLTNPKSYPRDLKALYERVKKTLEGESLQNLLDGVSESHDETNVTESYESTSNTPIPVFMPVSWTGNTSDVSWPITISYANTSGDLNTFYFTPEYTLPLCWLCKFKYWLRNKVFRKK